jgi:hypothetical protein
LDELTEEALIEIEENAIQQLKLKNGQDTQNAQSSEPNSSQKDSVLRSSEQSVEIIDDKRATSVDVATVEAKGKELLSANSSVTPTFKPAPTRRPRKAVVLKSPYANNATKKKFQCNKEVCQLYDSILQTHAHPDRSRDLKSDEYVLFLFLSPIDQISQCSSLCNLTFFLISSLLHKIIIINFWPTHIFLNELANSVKPSGDLINTVAEIGIYAINPKGRGAVKPIMPLHIAVSALVYMHTFF